MLVKRVVASHAISFSKRAPSCILRRVALKSKRLMYGAAWMDGHFFLCQLVVKF
jgi:hypothetical protein